MSPVKKKMLLSHTYRKHSHRRLQKEKFAHFVRFEANLRLQVGSPLQNRATFKLSTRRTSQVHTTFQFLQLWMVALAWPTGLTRRKTKHQFVLITCFGCIPRVGNKMAAFICYEVCTHWLMKWNVAHWFLCKTDTELVVPTSIRVRVGKVLSPRGNETRKHFKH